MHVTTLVLLFAQSAPALPGCEARPEVRQVLEQQLSDQALRNMKFTEQAALRRRTLEELIAKYPRELAPHRELIQFTRWSDSERWPALQQRYRRQAEQHPDDPLALYLAGLVYSGKDTPRSIQHLEQARLKSPDFPWPALQLAATYAGGKRADKKKAEEQITAFFAKCPSSTDGTAQWVLSHAGGPSLRARVAAALRTQLARETDPKRLLAYETLWGLEFRTRPPQEHEALRKQVALDLKRLESLNSKPDAEWLIFLKNGAKQSGAPAEIITAREDQVMQAFPHSEEAHRIVSERWKKVHKEPEDQKDTAGWAKYNAEYQDALKSWIARFTEDRALQHTDWFYAIYDLPDVPQKEGLQALDDYLAESTEYDQPSAWGLLTAATFLVDHKWQPERALDMLQKAERLIQLDLERQRSDNLSAAEEKMSTEGDRYQQQNLAGLVLRAAKLAGRPEEAERIKTSIEREPPTEVRFESDYWLNRARLAELEGHKADALTYYQKALHTRTPPNPYHGRLKDDLTDEARAHWKEMGGSETAWAVWSKPPAGKAQELAEGRWEKPEKAMPAFDLADLTGKSWRLKSLEGKSLLINVWATWCGPCQAELPKLEKLYEKVKDRSDLQILTFNIDTELGLVAPFVKEKGYTFPVLPANSFVLGVLDAVAIPQNWILDPKGAWRWSQLGYDARDPNWGETMVGKLESVKGQ